MTVIRAFDASSCPKTNDTSENLLLLYSCIREVSYDAKILASWHSLARNCFVYYIIYFIEITIYYYFMISHDTEINYAFRIIVTTYRLLYLEEFKIIKRKTRIKALIVAVIMRRAINRAENEDFNDVLAYLNRLT